MISETNAAEIVNYLFAAQTIQAVDGQARVWADYINAEVPDVTPAETLPAARRAIHDWAAQGRAWKVDLGRYVDAIRAVRHDRVVDELARGALTPPEALGGDPQLEAAWKRDVLAAISAGLPRTAAETRANTRAHITPTHQITTPHDTRALAAGIGE